MQEVPSPDSFRPSRSPTSGIEVSSAFLSECNDPSRSVSCTRAHVGCQSVSEEGSRLGRALALFLAGSLNTWLGPQVHSLIVASVPRKWETWPLGRGRKRSGSKRRHTSDLVVALVDAVADPLAECMSRGLAFLDASSHRDPQVADIDPWYSWPGKNGSFQIV